jgi:hypothetical protein
MLSSYFLSPEATYGLIVYITFLLTLWIPLTNPRLMFRAAAFGLGPSSVISIIQALGYEPVAHLTPHISGLFLNGNMMAEASALVITGCLIYRLCGCAILTLPALMLPFHRGSMIALAIACIVRLNLRLTYKFALLSLMGFAALAMWRELHVTGYWQSHVSEPGLIGSVQERLDIWQAAISGLTWSGHGVGSFRALFPLYGGPITDTMAIRPFFAHNDFLQLTFELGIFSVIPIALIIAPVLSSSPLKYVVLVFIVEAMFEFPLHMPATLFVSALCIGSIYREWLVSRIHILHGGVEFQPGVRTGHPDEIGCSGLVVSV